MFSYHSLLSHFFIFMIIFTWFIYIKFYFLKSFIFFLTWFIHFPWQLFYLHKNIQFIHNPSILKKKNILYFIKNLYFIKSWFISFTWFIHCQCDCLTLLIHSHDFFFTWCIFQCDFYSYSIYFHVNVSHGVFC